MGTSAVNYRRILQLTAEEIWAKTQLLPLCTFFFVLIHYAIDVYPLVSC